MLLEVNTHMTELGPSQLDVLEVVPMQQLLGGQLMKEGGLGEWAL